MEIASEIATLSINDKEEDAKIATMIIVYIQKWTILFKFKELRTIPLR